MTKCSSQLQRARNALSATSVMAPRIGPYTEPLPPKSTIRRMNTDRLKLMKSEFKYWFCCATKAPAKPQVNAAITNASTLNW